MKFVKLLLLVTFLISAAKAYQRLKAIRKVKHATGGLAIPNSGADPCGVLISVLKELLAKEERRRTTKHLKNALRATEQYARKGRRGARHCERMLKGLQG
ncbi:hypothetical protein D918_00194 [Trichuris suis]|nr:hypothetical protein D918_00194 [Trichuris suis]